jgi:hypothetical protein
MTEWGGRPIQVSISRQMWGGSMLLQGRLGLNAKQEDHGSLLAILLF